MSCSPLPCVFRMHSSLSIESHRQPPNKRLQLALPAFGERPLLCDKVSSLQLVTSRFGLCSVDPRAPQGAAEAQSR